MQVLRVNGVRQVVRRFGRAKDREVRLGNVDEGAWTQLGQDRPEQRERVDAVFDNVRKTDDIDRAIGYGTEFRRR